MEKYMKTRTRTILRKKKTNNPANNGIPLAMEEVQN